MLLSLRLISGVLKACGQRSRRFVAPLLIAQFLVVGSGCAGEPPSCFLDLSVHDSAGERVKFRIVSVTREDDRKVDFLKAPDEFRMVVAGERLRFPRKAANGMGLQLTLEDARGRRIIERLPLLGCEQRATIRRGQADSGADVFISSAEGRLAGCQLAGDWWIRAVPMFGTPDTSTATQGYVRNADGFFRVDFSSGERLIVVVGRGKEPVKVFAVNVTAGSKNNIGTVDLSGSCPK